MKWFLVIGLFVYYTELSKGSVIISPSYGANDKASPITETKEKEYLNTEAFSTYEDVRIEVECLSGSEWESNCHSCRCSEEGRAVCSKIDICDKGSNGEPLRCKPQTSFKRDCNTCRCLDNGLVLCTLKGCPRSSISVPKKSDLLPGKDCSPGTRWKSRCNECICSSEGLANCTKHDCSEKENEPEMDCAPDSVWKNDCNTCWCTSDGHAVCTRMGCSLHFVSDWNPQPVKPKNSTTVQPGQRYISPTRISDVAHKIKKRSVCQPNTIFKIDCNQCLCSPNGEDVTCTLKICIDENQEFVEQKKQFTRLIESNPFETSNFKKRTVCKPNSLFKVSCNECACAANGQSYSCTDEDCDDRAIADDVEVFKEEGGPDHIERHSVCKPRATFYMGCNTCRCNVDGSNYACTNKPCPLPEDVEIFKELEDMKPASKSAQNTSKAVVCTANQTFIKDCNTCWCNEDGTSFFCTRKVCIVEPPDDGSEENPEDLRTIKQQCRPDEVFELDCNVCRCNPDGQSYSCTRRLCVPDSDDKKIPPVSISPDNSESVFRRKRATSQQKTNPADLSPSRLAPTLKETPKTCQPGQEFRMDCNKCLCDNEGQDFSCTRIDCAAMNSNNGADRTKREVTSQVQLNCTPGSVFDQGCNVCQCTTDGNHAMCTMKRCHDESTDNDINSPESDPNFRCNPGEQFKRGCKDCTCSADGKSVFCTLRLCDQDINPTS